MSTFLYGRDQTIHPTKYLHIETDATGQVVAVWFRCQMLPFQQVLVNDLRADEMRREMNDGGNSIELHAVEISNT